MTTNQFLSKPDIKISVKQSLILIVIWKLMASQKNEFVPKIDPDYKFDRDTTLAFYLVLLLIKEF